MKDTKYFLEKSKKILGEKYNYNKAIYKTARNKVTITCPVHGYFEQTPDKHINSGQGCPSCKKSRGETKITTFLKKHNIKFTPQKKFKDCRNTRLLPFDFYLDDLNICIEYDGEQHYMPHFRIKYGPNKQKQQEISKRNDSIKTNYCIEKGIRLIRIPYWNMEKIDFILYRELILKSKSYKSKELSEKLKKIKEKKKD